jgi:ferredoxin-NADP reductase
MKTRVELEKLEAERLAPCAQKSGASAGRTHPEPRHPYRMEYERDRARIIHSRAFRRLEYKTQVFLNGTGDHLRTRLTHTIEVASISRTIARALGRKDALEVLESDEELMQQLRQLGEDSRRVRHNLLRDNVLRHLGLGGRYAIERFAPGEVVCHQDAPGRKVHLVLSGMATVVQREDDTEQTIAELLRGMLIGDQTILYDECHTASVVATTELETASLDGTWFRNNHAHGPLLHALVEAQRTMYRLPRRGRIRLRGDTVGSQLTITGTQTLPDGRVVASTCMVGHATISTHVIGAPEATSMFRFEDPAEERLRTVHLADGCIVEIESDDDWTQLPTLIELLLEGARVDPARFASLAVTGELNAVTRPTQTTEFVCHCARVSRVQLERVIQSGCRTLETVARATQATRDCGECIPAIKELLGDAEWTPARCDYVIPVTEDVRTFSIRPLRSKCLPWLPGQHIVLQTRIDGRWVIRPYTISGGQDAYEITVKREPNGAISQWLFDRLRIDSDLRVSAPAGAFHLTEDHHRDVVCLVGGIGITPVLAVARSLVAAPRDFRLFIDYSVSRMSQAIYREELEELHNLNPKIRVNLRVTERDGRLDRRRVHELVREYPDAGFYLCGRRAQMEAMERYLDEAEVPAKHVAALHFRSEAEWYTGLSGEWTMASILEPDVPVIRRGPVRSGPL